MIFTTVPNAKYPVFSFALLTMNRLTYAANAVKIAQHTIYPTIAFALSAETSAIIPKPIAPSIRLSRKVKRKNLPFAFICPCAFICSGFLLSLYLVL